MKKRLIDIEIYFDSELCELLGERGLHLYIGLWAIAEDSGVYEPKYADIALKMGALKFTEGEVRKYIEKLILAGKIVPFLNNGKLYHWIKNLIKHQGIKNPPIPSLPVPDWIKVEIKQFPSGKRYAVFNVIEEEISKNPIKGVNYNNIKNSKGVSLGDSERFSEALTDIPTDTPRQSQTLLIDNNIDTIRDTIKDIDTIGDSETLQDTPKSKVMSKSKSNVFDKIEIVLEDTNSISFKEWSEKLIEIFNSTVKYMPKVFSLSDKRREHLKARRKEHPELDWWKNLFLEADLCYVPGNPGHPNGWRPTFDWLIQNNDNYLKVLEGKFPKRTDTPYWLKGAEMWLKMEEEKERNEERGQEEVVELDDKGEGRFALPDRVKA